MQSVKNTTFVTMRIRLFFCIALMLPACLGLRAQERVVTDPNQSMTATDQKIEAAAVSAKAPSVSVVGDTLVFSASAYRLAEDASLEDLLKKIPGIEVNGNAVTLYGKQISELRVNGKRYFGGDVAAGLQNIPAELIDKVGAYERESDFSRLTGVDDGELVPVLDLKIKSDFLDGWKGRLTAGYGSSLRYVAKVNANKITKQQQTSLLANLNNIPGKASFNNASRTQLGGGSAGENGRRELGVSHARSKAGNELDWSVQYQGRDSYVHSLSQVQNIYAATTSFSNGDNSGNAIVHNPKGDLRWQWKPDKATSVVVKPVFSYSITDNWTHNLTGNFKKDPYGISEDPCSLIDAYGPGDPLGSIRSSTSDNRLKGFSGRLNSSIVLLWTRRMGKRGRSLSLQSDNALTLQFNDQGTNYRTVYNRTKAPTDTTRRQYIDQDVRNLSFGLQAAWNEPVAKGLFLQFSARGEYKDRSDVRSLYDLTRSDNSWTVTDVHRLPDFKSSLPSGLQDCFQQEVSYSGRYRYMALALNTNVRIVRKKFNMTAGVRLTPATQEILWPQGEILNSHRESVLYAAPNLSLNYKPTKRRKLTISYRSSLGQPSIYNLLPVSNGTNPLSVHIGNPALKPSNTHIVGLTYNASDFGARSSITADMQMRATENAISNSTEFDPETGGKTITPRNIEGNWYALGHLVLTKAFARTYFQVSAHTSVRYDNSCNYLYNKTLHKDEVNLTRRAMIKESLRGNYRNKWLDVTLDLGGDYTVEHSLLRPDLDQRPWSLVATLSTVASAPWGMRFTADFTRITQQGFVYGDFNRSYNVLNTGLSQSFLRKRLTARIEACDVLGELPNVVRRFSAESRSISVYNGVNSYVLLRLMWRF